MSKPHIRIHIDEGSMCGNVKEGVWCIQHQDSVRCESLNCKCPYTNQQGKFVDYWYELVKPAKAPNGNM